MCVCSASSTKVMDKDGVSTWGKDMAKAAAVSGANGMHFRRR